MISVLGEKEAMSKLGLRLRAERLRRNLSQEHMGKMLVARALGVFGYADALGELVPEVQPEMRLEDLLAPQRKHASRPRKT